MRGPYYRLTTWDRPTPPTITSNQLRDLRDKVNAKYRTRYRIEVQGAEAEPGTEPPVYVLLHDEREIGRGTTNQIHARLMERLSDARLAYHDGGFNPKGE